MRPTSPGARTRRAQTLVETIPSTLGAKKYRAVPTPTISVAASAQSLSPMRQTARPRTRVAPHASKPNQRSALFQSMGVPSPARETDLTADVVESVRARGYDSIFFPAFFQP